MNRLFIHVSKYTTVQKNRQGLGDAFLEKFTRSVSRYDLRGWVSEEGRSGPAGLEKGQENPSEIAIGLPLAHEQQRIDQVVV
jgi:hypothetical protein